MTRADDYGHAADVLRALNTALSEGTVKREDAAETLQVLNRTIGERDEWSYTAMMGAVKQAEAFLDAS